MNLQAAGQAISISGLTKIYDIARSKNKRIAVDHLDLSVSSGEIFGFLGPNGAGKTTTIKMLLSFIKPSAGSATIFGVPVALESSRKMVGYVPEQPYFPKFLSCIELVKEHGIMAGLAGRDAKAKAEDRLDQVGMGDVKHSRLSQLSKGMTQRVGLACALVADPQLLILDEPSSGLDPVGRRELRELLTGFKDEGKTIFLSSHLLSEMESVCDRVGVLANGKLIACGAPEEIVESRDQVMVEFDGSLQHDLMEEQLAQVGGKLLAKNTVIGTANRHEQQALVPSQSVYKVIEILKQKDAKLLSITSQRETLEDAFLRLVKGAAV